MVSFADSTQKQRWTFTAEQLDEIRTQNRNRSLEAIARVSATQNATDSSGALQEGSAGALATPGLADAISADEEVLICRYYQSKVQDICRSLPHFPRKVQATALTYFKRFYLRHSPLDHVPVGIMLTAIYLAGKTEEAYISADEFGRQVQGVNPQQVLRNELMLLQALDFDLVVFAPYKAIDGFIQDLEDCQSDAGCGLDDSLRSLDAEALAAVRQRAYTAADLLMLTDAPLMYPPGVLALAALRSAFRKAGTKFGTYLPRVNAMAMSTGEAAPAPDVAARLERLEADLAAVDQLAVAAAQTPVSEAQAAAVDRKLRLCHNPLLDPGSQAFKAAAAAKDKERQEKRQKKLKARHARTASILGEVPAAVANGAAGAAAAGAEDGEDAAAGAEDGEDNHAAKRRKSEPA